MDLGLRERTVIITGGSGGLGRELAPAFAAEGANVLVTYHRGQHEAEQVAKEIGAAARVVSFDMADPAAAAGLVDTAFEWTGRVDVVINNAAMWPAPVDGGFEATPEDTWLSTFRLNVEGAIRLTRAVAPIMRERRWGRLVHMSSLLARDGGVGTEYYATAKAALHGFSRSAAVSLGSDGDILSNVAMLGLIRTATNTMVTDAVGDQYSAMAPLGRLLNAAEVAPPVVFLASAANTGITGQVVTVSGGA